MSDSLVLCPSCEHEVHEFADKCPNCGRDFAEEGFQIWWIGVLVSILPSFSFLTFISNLFDTHVREGWGLWPATVLAMPMLFFLYVRPKIYMWFSWSLMIPILVKAWFFE